MRPEGLENDVKMAQELRLELPGNSLEIRLSMCAWHGKFKMQNARSHTYLLCSRGLYCWESEVPESAEQEWLRVGNTALSPALRWWLISAVTCQYDEYSCAHSTPPANLPQNLHKKVCSIQSIVITMTVDSNMTEFMFCRYPWPLLSPHLLGQSVWILLLGPIQCLPLGAPDSFGSS